jgi:cellobiose phosphorylase
MIAGKDAARPGEAKNSWLTGTAAWNWYAVTQFILGIKPDYNGILIDPCIPSTMSEYTVTRRFRGAKYTITILNPDGVCRGIKSINLNGQPLSGNIIPTQREGSDNFVTVVLGKQK